MPRWLPSVLTRIRALASAGRVTFTVKVGPELDALRLRREDAIEILLSLGPGDYPIRLRSTSSDEWLYVFRPAYPGLRLYLKLVIRTDCVVISCHEDRPEGREGPAHDQ